MYHLPHGHAVAVCMPEVWGYMLEHTDNCIDVRGTEHLKKTLSDISKIISLDSFIQLMTDLEMKNPISENKEADVNKQNFMEYLNNQKN